MINLLLPSKAATVETLGHPAAGVIGWFDGTKNTSGVSVSEDSALTFSAVWCATRIISETLATLPCVLYRRTSDDGRERAVDDPRYNLVHDQPHPAMSAVTFFETQTAQMVLRGNTYARIRSSGMQVPTSLEIRHPETVTVEVDGDQPRYKVSEPKETLNASEMLHPHGLGGDGLTGWSAIKHGQQSVGIGMAADNYAGSQFGSGAMPGGVLTHPMRLDKPAREQFRREWNEIHQGPDNAHRVGILHGGMEFKALSMSNEDAQFLQSRKFNVREIARWFRLPPHMLADLEDSSVRANIEQQAIEFVVYSMRPWIMRWQQELNRKLLTADEQQTMYFEFLLDSLLSGETKARYDAYAVGRQWGWLSVNDIRRRENMNVIDGGDAYMQPTNMETVGGNANGGGNGQPTPDSLRGDLLDNYTQSITSAINAARELKHDLTSANDGFAVAMQDADSRFTSTIASLHELRQEIRQDIAGVDDKAQVRGHQAVETARRAADELLRTAMRQALGIEKAEIAKAARKVARGLNFVQWADEFYERHGKVLKEKLKPAANCYREIQPDVQDIERDIVEAHCHAHVDQLLWACDGPREGFAERIQEVLDGWDAEMDHISFMETSDE